MPEARSGLEWVEPAPGAFVHRTFGDGEAIDWTHGIFVLDVETGLTEGWAVANLKSVDDHPYGSPSGGWIESLDEARERRLLLDRETGQSWRWPISALRLAATSGEHLLFEDLDDDRSTGRFTLVDRRMTEVNLFSVDIGDGGKTSPIFSPDGSTIALAAADKVYLVPARPSGCPEILFEGQHDIFGSASVRRQADGSLYVYARYRGRGLESHYFDWDGVALSAPDPVPSCGFGRLSPDARYEAVRYGAPYFAQYSGFLPIENNPWPWVAIVDTETCTPIFRVLSALADSEPVSGWRSRWLPTGDGFVARGRDRSMILRVRPTPELVPLPEGLPDPAPTGGDRYFGYGPRVYDAHADRWRGPAGVTWLPSGGWGDSPRERWFSIGYWGEGGYRYLLLPPKIEYPPFSEEIAFRVARTGGCLRLREEPDEGGRVLRCLPEASACCSPNATPRRSGTSMAISGRRTPRSRCAMGHGSTSARRTAPRAG